ncbi:MAG: hypothetical protein GY796_23615 [Chloroflexi bacterium]|nr:hypothetical protein [Chloroflexota bacterium]
MTRTRLYIHVGTHKTGSTAIQHALRQNQFALREENLVFLPLPGNVRSLMLLKELDYDIIELFKRELNRQVTYNQKKEGEGVRFLMSWEGFSGNPLSGYKNAGIVAEHLKKITDYMDVRIIVYLRRQDDFLESLYTQKIHEGESYTFQSFIETYSTSLFDWERFLHCYSEHFGKENVIARRYDKAFLPESDSLLKDFSQVVGIDNEQLLSHIDTLTPNRGYSRDALEIARLSNPHLSNDERQYMRRILQQTSSKQPFERYSFWDNEKRDAFLAQYLESNATVAKAYFNEPSGALFPSSNIGDEDQVYQGLSLETVTLVLVKAIVTERKPKTESVLLQVLVKVERKISAFLNRFPRLKSELRYLSQKLGV